MKIKTLLIVGLALCLTSSLALADTTVTGAGGWQDFDAGNINQDGKPYWDQVSLDSGNRNVGYFLTGTGGEIGFSTNYLGTSPQFWGMAYSKGDDGATNPGAAAPRFYLTTTFPSSANTFLLRITSWSGTDAIGIYDWTDRTIKTQIFGPGDSVGATKTVTVPSSFGFYGVSPDGTFYSQSGGNPSGETSHQHFALFRDKDNPGVFYLGFEDKAGTGGTEGPGDFNDLVIQFTPVPLPPSVLLLGSGLLGLVGLGWRRARKES